VLPNDYYVRNFCSLVTFVGDTYGTLLSADEQLWLSDVLAASEPAQRLYIRLLGRRGSVFRGKKLNYPEITDISAATEELVERKLIDVQAPADLTTLLQSFTKPELIRHLKLPNLKQQRRAVIEQHVIERAEAVDIKRLQQVDTWLTVLGAEHYSLFTLCFFGNMHQDTTEFVLRDLGTVRYEPYVINAHSRAFRSREQIDAHCSYFACDAQWDAIDTTDADALLALDAALPIRNTSDSHLVRRIDRMRNRIARQLERLHQLPDALRLYQKTQRPPSRERQVRILTALERIDEAWQLCTAMQNVPVADEETQFADSMLPKLAKLRNQPSVARSRHRPETTRLTLARGEGRVELVARDFYARFGACFYVENSLVNGILGLFIWDLIFLPIPGVFFNPFQTAPADFYEPEFRSSRATELAERRHELEDEKQFASRVWQHFDSRQGVANPLVHWKLMSEELVSLALMRIPMHDWRVLYDRILTDLRYNTSGLPDLVLFPDKGGYEFLEIKGPGDALQKNQLRWMRYFAEHRIPHRVIHVRWALESADS